MRYIQIIIIMLTVSVVSCSSFIKEETVPDIKNFEKNTYILKKDVRAGEHLLKKGSRVRVLVVIGDEWIKVYGYPADENVLKTKRVLIKELYVFEDEFPDGIFTLEIFKKKFNKILEKEN